MVFYSATLVKNVLKSRRGKKMSNVRFSFEKKVMLTKLKILKKLCDLKNFLSNKCCFFPRPISDFQKWTNINVHFRKMENSFENSLICDVSLYSNSWPICRCLLDMCLCILLSYIIRDTTNIISF